MLFGERWSSRIYCLSLFIFVTKAKRLAPLDTLDGCKDFTQLQDDDPEVAKWNGILPYESNLKVYRSACMAESWAGIGSQAPPATPAGTTFNSAIDAICEDEEHVSCSVVIHGGCVRDLMHGLQPKDIDLVWSVNTESLMNNMKAKGFQIASTSDLHFEYLKFGDEVADSGFEPLEGNGFGSIFTGTPCEAENNVNSLMYDPRAGLVIDPNGQGVDDNILHKFQIPAHCTDVAIWMKYGRKTALRYFKMIEKGYTDSNPARDIAWVSLALFHQIESKGQAFAAATYQNFMSQAGPSTSKKYKTIKASIEEVLPPSLVAQLQNTSSSFLELGRHAAASVWEARDVEP